MDKNGDYDNLVPVLKNLMFSSIVCLAAWHPKWRHWPNNAAVITLTLQNTFLKPTRSNPLQRDADTAFVLQTGLAPALSMYWPVSCTNSSAKSTTTTCWRNDHESGALPQNATTALLCLYLESYWCTILKNAVIVDNYKQTEVAALSDTGHWSSMATVLNNYTSGGAANLPEAFSGKIKNCITKPSASLAHYQWVKRQLETIPGGLDKDRHARKNNARQHPIGWKWHGGHLCICRRIW